MTSRAPAALLHTCPQHLRLIAILIPFIIPILRCFLRAFFSFRINDFADLKFLHQLSGVRAVADIFKSFGRFFAGLFQQHFLATRMLVNDKNRRKKTKINNQCVKTSFQFRNYQRKQKQQTLQSNKTPVERAHVNEAHRVTAWRSRNFRRTSYVKVQLRKSYMKSGYFEWKR